MQAHKLSSCRLAKGKDMEYICGAICGAAMEMQEGPELNALKAWTWQFGLQLAELMAKVSYCSAVTHAFLNVRQHSDGGMLRSMSRAG